MNATFDLNRFGKLIKADILINKGTVIKLLLGLLLLMGIVYFFVYMSGTTLFYAVHEGEIAYVGGVYETYLAILNICIFLIPILIFFLKNYFFCCFLINPNCNT